jgi:hypothetical protein
VQSLRAAPGTQKALTCFHYSSVTVKNISLREMMTVSVGDYEVCILHTLFFQQLLIKGLLLFEFLVIQQRN